MSYSAIHIAKLLLLKSKEKSYSQELMTNLKLQKMLYYEQGFHLAAFGTPLFDERIEAWMYGPVVPVVYELFCDKGACGIEPFADEVFDLTEDEAALFNNVFDVYNQFSATKLLEMTHDEPPWKNSEVGKGCVISNESMETFFKTRLC